MAVDEAPLLDGSQASAGLRAAVAWVFARHDTDADGALSRAELAALITAANGSAPPPAAVQGMLRSFRSNARGLVVDGRSTPPRSYG
jgi:Ca2+-binding EF-hand superfamily protein